MNKTEDNWIQILWNWADENSVSDLEWIEHDSYLNGGYFRGLPRSKEKLLIKKQRL